MANGDVISQEILEQAQGDVREALKQKRLSKTDRAILKSQDLQLTFMLTDHRMLTEMYPYYKEQKEKTDSEKESLLGYKRLAFGSLLLMVVHIILDGLGLPGLK